MLRAYLSAARREGLAVDALAPALAAISLVLPERSLEREVRDVLGYGYLRSELAFLSCDTAQRRVAHRLGFVTPSFAKSRG